MSRIKHPDLLLNKCHMLLLPPLLRVSRERENVDRTRVKRSGFDSGNEIRVKEWKRMTFNSRPLLPMNFILLPLKEILLKE